jgi:predicted DCC family thiol-disulfide oxidoreductase YuxK
MKTLKDHVILYDEVCPMCTLYTGAFVKSGMLDGNGREPYQNIGCKLRGMIDTKRAVNEIALVDRRTGEVFYGVRSLFRVLEHSFPVFRPLFRFRPFAWVMGKIYSFISYNRRVIMPAGGDAARPEHNPSFNLKYRLLYLLFTWLVTATLLYGYSHLLEGVVPASNFYREFLVCGGQMVWQGLILFFLDREKLWDYLGNMMTISFSGGLLLGLVSLFGGLADEPLFFAGAFMAVAGLMLLEHIRRMKLLKITWVMTLAWVAYRVLLLFVIL